MRTSEKVAIIETKAIKALLAEKDAALESLKARAELADKYRKRHSCLVGVKGATCDICKAYDALSGPREGEQDATVPKTVSSA